MDKAIMKEHGNEKKERISYFCKGYGYTFDDESGVWPTLAEYSIHLCLYSSEQLK